ncbi:DegT/DnrJ/EryC1/StrS family aminotransferase [Amycolatopsis sp. NPDC051716]|jgi:dTDP-4-amino-4,6-dideoxygalactose transaminase|uniref:DegT/DnrJ/EryC1/StrS family aminotransferase n=1 Tax=Amycolatopsis sp. NPDC051716 TaxID=3155804 RepID=UPI00344A7DD7
MINVFQPTVGQAELAAVADVFESNWLGKGGRTAEFEAMFADHLGITHDRVTTVSSCTEALFISMQLAEVGEGDEVVLPTVSFVGAGNAVAAHGATPVFCDVDPRTLNPTVDNIEAVLTPRTKAVILLHYGGYPGQITEIAELCRRRRIFLVEDSANSIASRVDGQACGTIGDVGTWSFDSAKIAVAGDGGMLSARDPELVRRAARFAYFGLEQFSGYSQAKSASKRWWDFQITSFSRRSVMNDIQSAIGLVQLGKLKDFVARREDVVARYDEELSGVAGILTPPALPPGHRTSHYLYWVQLDERIRDEVAKDLLENGIYTTFRYRALHQVEAYGSAARLPDAERAVARTLCLPLHQGLTDDDVETVIAALRASVARRSASAPGFEEGGNR